MNKLMSSLVAAAIAGTFSLSGIAADAAKTVAVTPAAASAALTAKGEKPSAMSDKKHLRAGTKPEAAAASAMPAAPARK